MKAEKLSLRLQAVASYVKSLSCVVDVGADHGLLSLHLANLNHKVLAIENKTGPFEILKKACSSNKNIECLLSDGLNLVDIPFDCLVLAGMGYLTIQNILLNAKKKLNKVQIILEVKDDIELLRKMCNENNFKIVAESIIYEDHFYHILVVELINTTLNYSQQEIMFGPILLKNKSAEFYKYWKYRLNQIESYLPKLINDQSYKVKLATSLLIRKEIENENN